jgi:hypothetical protein
MFKIWRRLLLMKAWRSSSFFFRLNIGGFNCRLHRFSDCRNFDWWTLLYTKLLQNVKHQIMFRIIPINKGFVVEQIPGINHG